MRSKMLGNLISRTMIVSGVIFSGASVIYGQSVVDLPKVVEAIATSSAQDPLLAVIKIMAWVIIGSLALSAWLVRLALRNAEAQTKLMSKPCVLAHTNPQLFAKLLELQQ